MGLREVTKHLKLNQLKCIIISPNMERIQSKGMFQFSLIRGYCITESDPVQICRTVWLYTLSLLCYFKIVIVRVLAVSK